MRRMFAAIAGKYDLLNTLLSFGRDQAWRRFAVSRAALRPGGLAVDVAAGTAELTRQLARRNGGGYVVGVDFSPEMLAVGRAKLLASKDGKNVELVLGDGYHLPFSDATFDCATIAFALRNVADLPGLFREMGRVVKPGGRVVSLELTRPPSRLVRTVYYLYLLRIAPFVGGLISGQRGAYKYLPESIVRFPPPEKVKEIMEGAGLCQVTIHCLTLGAAVVHVGVKETNGAA